ncbi:putative transmembrane protein coupled to NADH-ubiquinone oxidoreductase [Leifsonia rubra CMS 76R]|nr:putative transmembrane protein coupled to NADH-ubiquinone oxidoreductase [Leifsonia rubra CMS 76R]
MSLILRTNVASAAHDVTPTWPLDSFVAINPLAGKEGAPFDAVELAGAATTRTIEAYLADLASGRIREEDLELALHERVPELAGRTTIGSHDISLVRLASLDMQLSQPSQRVSHLTEISDPIDRRMSTWIAAFLTRDPLWTMPHHHEGFYRSWKKLARFDRSLPKNARRKISELPDAPDSALAHALAHFAIAGDAVTPALRRELAALPGWVAHIKWRAGKQGDIDLTGYLAVRFSLRSILDAPPEPEEAPHSDSAVDDDLWVRAERVAEQVTGDAAHREDVALVARVLAIHGTREHPFTWQKAYELHYRNSLIGLLKHPEPSHESAEVQVVMCIDPRSEGMRRHLESDATVATVGFAGFFGVPIRFSSYHARGAINSLPALLEPRHHVTEQPIKPELVEKNVSSRRLRDAMRSALHSAESTTASPFALAEIAGLFYGAASTLRTFAPALSGRITQLSSQQISALDSTVTVADAFTLEERASLAETAIRMMGLTSFAPLIVLTGHASESMNNLYQSALDCGACGGNPGAANARSAVAIFNDVDVRSILQRRGISIPSDCVFVAAEHNTVTDAISILDGGQIPPSHMARVKKFGELQRGAAHSLLRERAHDLPGASARSPVARIQRRAHDWSEVYPELGLAGNAAMIIGPREITRGVDLSRRVFLHSYSPELDASGSALESIMTAPMVVAQWINHQYYFSTINPETLGAGTKTIHNAIGVTGVLSGHEGDLRRGLPWQSVGVGADAFHEPMRLAVLIQAPLVTVGQIVSRNQVLRDLLDNDWITLTAREDSDAPWYRHTSVGWKKCTTTTTVEGPHSWTASPR